MPVVESRSTGQSPPVSSKKEKKKQAKEERDRQKQAEKKKRRLEKALATATAIRIELELKKQKRKEEEKRLDEEGAALAEAVALQVLGEEDREIQTMDLGFMEQIGLGFKESGRQIGIRQYGDNERLLGVICTGKSDEQSWDVGVVLERGSQLRNVAESCSAESGCSSGEADSSVEDEFRFISERARDAEIAAGLAAARAVAALRIAEEARAEAKAAKIAAQMTATKNWDNREPSHTDGFMHKCILSPKSAEEERDELKAQVLQMECILQEKTRKIFELEQDLEHTKQYMLELIESMTTKSSNNDTSNYSSKRAGNLRLNCYTAVWSLIYPVHLGRTPDTQTQM